MYLLEMTVSQSRAWLTDGRALFGTCVLENQVLPCGVLLQTSLMHYRCAVPLTGAKRRNCHHGNHQQWEIYL